MYRKPIKACFIGDTSVGKTALLDRLVNNRYVDEYKPTVGGESQNIIFKKKGKEITLNIWDTAGQERYRGLTQSYLNNGKIMIVCFSINDHTSFEHAFNDWWYYINDSVDVNEVCIVYVLTKADLLVDEKDDYEEEINKIVASKGCDYFKTSALNGDGTDDLKKFLQDMAYKFNERMPINEALEEVPESKKKNCC